MFAYGMAAVAAALLAFVRIVALARYGVAVARRRKARRAAAVTRDVSLWRYSAASSAFAPQRSRRGWRAVHRGVNGSRVQRDARQKTGGIKRVRRLKRQHGVNSKRGRVNGVTAWCGVA